jgi:type IV pilus assembly protein PilP
MRVHPLLPLLFCSLLLAGCAGEDHSDLRQFMKETGLDGKVKMEPLPPVVPPDTFEYQPAGLEDPFKPRNLRPTKNAGGFQPDFARPKERLEEFPLDALRMSGILMMRGKRHAIVRDPEGTLHRVTIGAHIGQNFGVVTAVKPEGLDILEITQDSSGNWTKTKAVLAAQGQEN